MISYRITFINNSTQPGHICLYQADPQRGNADSLAWMTQFVNPGTQATFVWSMDYCFFWNQQNSQPGQAVSASQTLPMDPENNRVTLSKIDGGYVFGTPRPGPQPGQIYIQCDSNVGMNEVTVGFGLALSGIMGQQAQPNMNYSFAPPPGNAYFMAFGQFQTGQSLNGANLSVSTALTFPGNSNSLTVALNLDQTWSVVPA